jgi:hypothetical protein
MMREMKMEHYDVVVVGGGVTGVAAAIAAAKNGAKTILVEAGPTFGGELLTGMSVDGALNARNQYVLGGIARELFDECAQMDGFIGPINDFRLIAYVCLDPEVVRIALARLLDRYHVTPLLYSTAEEIVMDGDRVGGVIVVNRNRRTLLTADFFIDCSGDGDIAVMAGAPYEISDEKGELQPLSIMFRMSGVENLPLLSFVREHPENLALGESEVIRDGKTDAELAAALYRQGEPSIFFKATGPLMQAAIRKGDLFPTALIMIQPTSKARKEVCVNATRVAENIDGTRADGVSQTLARLMDQVWICAQFLKNSVPGFEGAALSAIAPRIGIRETRRIVGEDVLTGEDVLSGRKRSDGVAKGSHHIDIHQDGERQVRIPVANGGSYDIPWGCLLPKNVKNIYVAGRCLSSTRDGQGSARMMGSCMGMGQAAGTAAALSVAAGSRDIRDLDVKTLREVLKKQGAILDGVE